MKLGVIAIAALLAVGLFALEGVAENVAGEGIVTGSAEASCTYIGDECVTVCVPKLEKFGIYCLQ